MIIIISLFGQTRHNLSQKYQNIKEAFLIKRIKRNQEKNRERFFFEKIV